MSDFAFAARLAASRIHSTTWYGMSGERITGMAVAAHLDATARLMRRDNWDPQIYGASSGRLLIDALRSTRLDGHHDEDTQIIGRDLMEQILKAATDAPYVDVDVWAEKSTRTLAEILDLLAETANFARTYGPRPQLAAA